MLSGLISSLRPQQWLKNGFVFAPPVLSGRVASLPGEKAEKRTLFFPLCDVVLCVVEGDTVVFSRQLPATG